MSWLGAVGGFVKDRVEDKLARKYPGVGQQPDDPNQSASMQQPDPIQDTLGYAKYKAQQTPLGRAIAGPMNRYRQHHADQAVQANAAEQPMPYDPNQMTPPQLPQPEAQGDSDLAGLQPEMMSQGRMVTKPTLALIGDRGPEAVVPMNANPANKVSMPMPHRYRR